MRLLSDERLARLAAGGSQAAFAAIFERHHQALHRYCHSILGNGHDAADALQNTMFKALRALPGETRQIALRAWLYRIAHNESISLLPLVVRTATWRWLRMSAILQPRASWSRASVYAA